DPSANSSPKLRKFIPDVWKKYCDCKIPPPRAQRLQISATVADCRMMFADCRLRRPLADNADDGGIFPVPLVGKAQTHVLRYMFVETCIAWRELKRLFKSIGDMQAQMCWLMSAFRCKADIALTSQNVR